MKRVALLGATGSIGRQAIEIVEAHPELELCAAASGSTPLDDIDAPLKEVGGDLTDLLERAQPDVVLNAVVGFAGVHATLWALEQGVDLALANKESLVAAGELALAAQRRGGGRILPVDSEHSALFQCLEGREPEQVDSLVLTGSGGPFRGRTRDELTAVTPEEALAHPTWRMGPKITVDSATLANKGLELIEAHFLFGIPYERIEVVLQPTSIVHSLVRFRDGAALAHLGYPDMRVPISYALTYPERAATPLPPLDLTSLTLEFQAPDLETFPLLALEFGYSIAAHAVRMRPRCFSTCFLPTLVKVKQRGIEYGMGAIPLGGFVRIPGMHRPASADLTAFMAPALREEPGLAPAVQR